jgi:hypothetical protein
MSLLTPPLTPITPASLSHTTTTRRTRFPSTIKTNPMQSTHSHPHQYPTIYTSSPLSSSHIQSEFDSESNSPELLTLPEPINIPSLYLPNPSLPIPITTETTEAGEGRQGGNAKEEGGNGGEAGVWRPNMTAQEKDQRREYLASGRGRGGLRIVIVTGEF